MIVSLLCPSTVPSTRTVCRFPFDLQHLFMTPAGRRTSALICLMWLGCGRISASVIMVEIEESNVSTGSNDEIKASGLPFTARGKMTSILVFVAEQTSSLRCAITLLTHPLISDAGKAPRHCEPKEKLPWRENIGHFDVTRYVLEDGKAGDLPHTGYYGYNLRECINVLSNLCCPTLITQNPKGIYEAVDFLQQLRSRCVLWLLGGLTLLSPKGAYF